MGIPINNIMPKKHVSKDLGRPVRLRKAIPCCINTTKLRLEVKKSQIENAGNGVYTKESIPNGTLIGYYEGKVSQDEKYISDYTFTLSKKWFVDGLDYPRSYIAMVNDPFNCDFEYNCEFDLLTHGKDGKPLRFKDRRVFLVSTKDIEAGEELYASYGDDYWNCDSRKNYVTKPKKKKETKKITKKIIKKKKA